MREKGAIYWKIILGLAVLKLLVHFAANSITDFGLHRDEYLYFADALHLDWGYMEGPPGIAFIGKLSMFLFGESIPGARFFTSLVGAVTIVLMGVMIRDSGGGRQAQLLGCIGFLISPFYLGSNNLFQPVSFNHFWWFVIAFLLMRIVSFLDPNKEPPLFKQLKPTLPYWISLGAVAGFSILTKYSMVFFCLALLGALLISSFRRIFLTRYPYISLGIAAILALPNVIWQFTHDFPLARHMEELSQSQLVHMDAMSFFLPQVLDHFACSLLWIAGLLFLLFHRGMKSYQFLAFAYILVVLIIWSLSGKDYYTFGAYAMLFAAGAVAWEHWLGKRTWMLIPFLVVLNILVLPLAIPILKVDQMAEYSLWFKNKTGVTTPFRWEDGVVRDIRQDYADMLGWQEIPEKVAKIYHSLPDEDRKQCIIYGGGYGHAGVLNFYRKKYDLPPVYGFDASFVAWAPEDLEFNSQIQVDDRRQGESPYYHSVVLLDSISHPYARDPGYIYLKTQPKMDLTPVWKQIVRERRAEAGYR